MVELNTLYEPVLTTLLSFIVGIGGAVNPPPKVQHIPNSKTFSQIVILLPVIVNPAPTVKVFPKITVIAPVFRFLLLQ